MHVGLPERNLFLGLFPQAHFPLWPGSFAPKHFSLLICYKAQAWYLSQLKVKFDPGSYLTKLGEKYPFTLH